MANQKKPIPPKRANAKQNDRPIGKQAQKTMKRSLETDQGSASYCCESAEIVPVSQLPKEEAFPKRA
jgi:hypothetical protein